MGGQNCLSPRLLGLIGSQQQGGDVCERGVAPLETGTPSVSIIHTLYIQSTLCKGLLNLQKCSQVEITCLNASLSLKRPLNASQTKPHNSSHPVCSALTSGLCLSLAIRPSSSSTRSSLLSCPKEWISAVQQVEKMLLLECLRCLFESPQVIYWVISVNVNIHTHLSIWWAAGPGDCLCPEPAAGSSFPERLGSTTENTEHNIRYCWC